MRSKFLLVALSSFILSTAAHASLITIDPTSDGSLYTCAGCNTVSEGGYVTTGGYIQGAIKFSSAAITGGVSNVMLTLNPYGLPLWGATVDIFGYGTTIGALDETDANAGIFLGTLTLPSGLGYGQDAYFDVTSFVANVHSPYIAFNLQTTDTDVFSSLEYNYGHPSQLLVTSVPEPSAIALFAVGIVGLCIRGTGKSGRAK